VTRTETVFVALLVVLLAADLYLITVRSGII